MIPKPGHLVLINMDDKVFAGPPAGRPTLNHSLQSTSTRRRRGRLREFSTGGPSVIDKAIDT